MKQHPLRACAVALAALGFCASGAAAPDYPVKPVRYIVPMGGPDAFGRFIKSEIGSFAKVIQQTGISVQ